MPMKYFSIFMLVFLVGVVVGSWSVGRPEVTPAPVVIGSGQLRVTHYPARRATLADKRAMLSEVKRAWGIEGTLDCRSLVQPEERRTVQP